MTREIKFRAWHEHNKKMVYGPTDDNVSPSWVLAMCSANNMEPMQYTGLNDRDNKEIYEGDIIKDSFGQRIGVVKYNKYVASYELADYDGIHLFTANNSENFFEIIGNIYENPELIT